jgi:predicted nuclease of predicted toxin-antitoxin system
MKLSEFMRSAKSDPDLNKGTKEWTRFTQPKRKVKLFLDRNIPKELTDAIEASPHFKITGIAREHDSDEFIWDTAKRQNAIILSLDKGDFWNDTKFPLRESPGLILLASREQKVDVYIEALNLFLFGIDFVGGIRVYPDLLTRSKYRISMTGFVLKFINYAGGREDVAIEYD